jgi:uncharacterized lipoprotein YajG
MKNCKTTILLIVSENKVLHNLNYIIYICFTKTKIKQMKKILLLLAAPGMLFFAGCGGTKTEETTASMPGMMQTTITVNGNQLSIMVPDSSKGKMEVVEQSWGAT